MLIVSVLENHGIIPLSWGDRGRCRCPVHQGSNETSFSYDGEVGYCFACGWGGNSRQLEASLAGAPMACVSHKGRDRTIRMRKMAKDLEIIREEYFQRMDHLTQWYDSKVVDLSKKFKAGKVDSRDVTAAAAEIDARFNSEFVEICAWREEKKDEAQLEALFSTLKETKNGS